MRPELDDELFRSLSAHLSRYTGLHFPLERRADLLRGMATYAAEQDKSIEDCILGLLAGPLSEEQIKSLAIPLTVGETYFFRDPVVFETLRLHVLPPIIEARRQASRHIRIWSAGCSSGEEAYSIAILLERTLPEPSTWNISVLATDIDTQALNKAAAGRYGHWSFRDPPVWLRDNYFQKTDNDDYEIHPRIRRLVTFSYLNLAAERYPMLSGTVDIVLCRNVLMYLDPSVARNTVARLSHVITENGWLIVTPAEASLVGTKELSPVNLSGLILHHKQTLAPVADASRQADIDRNVAETAGGSATRLKPVQATPVAMQKTEGNDYAVDHDMVVALADKGELTLALQYCDKAITADRLNPVWHYLLATILQELGQLEKAVAALHKALYLDQNFVMAHFTLGNLYRQQGRSKLAFRHLQNALNQLHDCNHDEVLPESSGITVGRLKAMIEEFMSSMEKIA